MYSDPSSGGSCDCGYAGHRPEPSIIFQWDQIDCIIAPSAGFVFVPPPFSCPFFNTDGFSGVTCGWDALPRLEIAHQIHFNVAVCTETHMDIDTDIYVFGEFSIHSRFFHRPLRLVPAITHFSRRCLRPGGVGRKFP